MNFNYPFYALKEQSEPQRIKLACLDVATGDFVAGCRFQVAPLLLGEVRGGHGHTNTDSKPRVLGGTESLLAYDGALHSVYVEGQNLTYWAPIVSGDVKLIINGFDQNGNQIEGAPSITFRVGVKGLAQLASGSNYRLTGVRSYPDPTSYHQQNHFVSTDGSRISLLAAKFYNDNKATLGLNDNSLPQGGVFDIGLDWKPSHKAHRYGRSADVDHCAAIATEADPFPQHNCFYDSDAEDCSEGCVLVDDDDFEDYCKSFSGRKVVEASLHCEFNKTN
jgi:hypothetical protein